MRKLVTGCYAAMLVLSAALPAAASQTAPRYQSSEPSDGATVHEPPDRVEATFDQPLDESSRLLVQDECGRRIDDRTTEVEGNTMSTSLTKKPSGEYHVEYKAVGVGGVTGTGKGHFMFTVHGGKACDGKKKHDHDNDKDEGHNGHEKNNRHENGNHGNDNHENTAHETTDHDSGNDHDTHAAGRSGDTHSDHEMGAGGGGHDGDHKNKHEGHGNDEGDDPVASGGAPGITSNDTSRKLLSRADSATLLLSLGLCLALGVLGGAILRASGAR